MTDIATIKTGVTLHQHATAADFAAAVADRLTMMLQAGLSERQSASFVVPGGTTPTLFTTYKPTKSVSSNGVATKDAMAFAPAKRGLPWIR